MNRILKRKRARVLNGFKGGSRQDVYTFVRTAYFQGAITIAGGVAGGQGFSFQVSDLPNITEFENLYDQFRINKVKFQLIPRFSESSIVGTTSSPTSQMGLGNLWSVIDYDDKNVPTNVTDLLQYQTLKRTQFNKTHTRAFVPACTPEIYSTGVTTTYGIKKRQWIDMAAPQTQHYGVKVWYDGNPGTATIVYDLVVMYNVSFKGVR